VAPHIPKDDKVKLPLRGHTVVKLVIENIWQ
jgi:hypothetical protein